MTDIAKLAIALDTKSLESGLTQLDKLSTKAGASETATAKLKKESAALAVSQNKLAQINSKLESETDEVTRSTLLASKANLEYANANAQASIKSQALAIQTGKAEKSTKGMGGASRNLSFQLNQVAQQASVTGDYMGAIAVQLPDMLLSFGTLGILVGAAAGVMAGPLMTALGDTESQSEDTKEEIQKLADSFDDLTRAEKGAARITVIDAISEGTVDLRKARGELDTLVFKFDALGRAFEAGRISSLDFKLESKELTDQISVQEGVVSKAEKSLEERRTLLDGLKTGTLENKEAIEDMTSALQSELDKLTMSESALLKRKLLQAGAKDEQVANALAIQSSIDKIEKENKAIKDQENLRRNLTKQLSSIEVQQSSPAERARMQFEERNNVIQLANEELNLSEERYNELRTQNAEKLSADLTAIERKTQDQKNMILTEGQQAALAASSELFGNLAAIAREGGKEQFEEYKALASAQALISASLAAIKALAEGGPILGPILAASIGALTAVQVAKIQGQEYQGARAMGGQVSSGNSYLVGENGPEIVHMNGNGNVQANHNLGGDNNVTVNMTFQSGVTKADLAAALPSVSKAVYNQVFAAINAGGTESQAVRRRA